MADAPNDASDKPIADGGDGEDLVDTPGDPRSRPDVDRLYLQEASCFRPVMPGDIFRDVPVPGCTDAECDANLTMVVGHPSAMRSGGALKERVRAAPVVVKSKLSSKKIATGSYDYFPLPKLAVVAKGNGFSLPTGPWATYLEAAALVSSSELHVRKRVACLDTDGIRYLMQCVSFCDTRICVRPDSVLRVLKPKLIEIEHLENWNEDLEDLLAEGKDDPSLEDRLLETARKFEAMMEEERQPDGMTLHQMLDQLSVRQDDEAAKAAAAELVTRVGTIIETERAMRLTREQAHAEQADGKGA